MKIITKCVVTGCQRPLHVKKHGLCVAHLRRFYKDGDVGSDPIKMRKNHKPFKYKGSK